jgi:hypothetical protein
LIEPLGFLDFRDTGPLIDSEKREERFDFMKAREVTLPELILFKER